MSQAQTLFMLLEEQTLGNHLRTATARATATSGFITQLYSPSAGLHCPDKGLWVLVGLGTPGVGDPPGVRDPFGAVSGCVAETAQPGARRGNLRLSLIHI